MARPLRILIPGGYYHITCRGNERKSFYKDDTDRSALETYWGNSITRRSVGSARLRQKLEQKSALSRALREIEAKLLS
jgi:hypothetical protein